MVTDAKLKRLMRKRERLNEKIEVALHSDPTWGREDRCSDILAYAVGLPIAFVIIVWWESMDWMDDMIFNLKKRLHG